MVHTETEIAEQIMVDLVTQGYSGNDLLEHFRIDVSQIRPAAEATVRLLAALGEGEMSAGKEGWVTADEVEAVLEHGEGTTLMNL